MDDLERLPTGFQRIAYDADSQIYSYRDREGKLWEGAPGCRFGVLRPVEQFTPYLCPRYIPQSDSPPGGFTYFPDTWDPSAEEDNAEDHGTGSHLAAQWRQLRRKLFCQATQESDSDSDSMISDTSDRTHSMLSSSDKSVERESPARKLRAWKRS